MSGELKNTACIAIRFALQQAGITAAIIGIRTPEQLAEAIDAVDMPALTVKELLKLQEAAPALLYKDHR